MNNAASVTVLEPAFPNGRFGSSKSKFVHPSSRAQARSAKLGRPRAYLYVAHLDEKPPFLQHRALIDKWTTWRLFGNVPTSGWRNADQYRTPMIS